ncbi:MAG: heat-inducible transcriptional repressor HrcA, partial [Acetobacteraceae bacterium]|nr:heat-inducible transcriptional repressor HrcA [Acetobacteraceae bacterium]
MLSERKRQVLRAVVDDYVATAAPVGSRTLARKYRLGVSPATIRNEMADLEEMGYLDQPHASAGRVPSDLGYRFYVDWLMGIRELAEAEIQRITELFARRRGQVEELIQHAAQVLSESTSHLALVLGPPTDRLAFKWVHLLPLDPGHAVLLLAASGGLVQHRLVEIPAHLEAGELQAVFSALN